MLIKIILWNDWVSGRMRAVRDLRVLELSVRDKTPPCGGRSYSLPRQRGLSSLFFSFRVFAPLTMSLIYCQRSKDCVTLITVNTSINFTNWNVSLNFSDLKVFSILNYGICTCQIYRFSIIQVDIRNSVYNSTYSSSTK